MYRGVKMNEIIKITFVVSILGAISSGIGGIISSLFDLNNKQEEIKNAIAISNFYINYIYDEQNLKELFNYEILNLEDLKPNIIDYETTEYKSIISELSKLNKKVVIINRKINKCLSNAKLIPKTNIKLQEENSKGLSNNCQELE